MKKSMIAIALLGLSSLAGAGSDTETIQFNPAAGLALQKDWTVEHELSSTEMFWGEVDNLKQFPGSLLINSSTSLITIDHYRASADGRPLDLRRTIASTVSMIGIA